MASIAPEVRHSSANPLASAAEAMRLVAFDSKKRGPVAATFERVLTYFEVVADFCTVAATILVLAAVRQAQFAGFAGHSSGPWGSVGFAAAIAVLFVVMLDRDGAYRCGNSLLRVKETERVLHVSIMVLLLAAPSAFLSNHLLSGGELLVAAAAVALALITEKQFVFLGVRWMHAQGYGVRNVVIYGAGYTGRQVLSALTRSPKLGLAPVVIVDDNPEMKGERIFAPAYTRQRHVPVALGPITRDLLRSKRADMVVIAIPSLDRQKFVSTVCEAASAGVQISFVPSNYLPPDFWTDYADVDGLLLTSVGGPPERSLYQFCKRAFDLIAGSVLLLLLAPIFILIGMIIRAGSDGPAIFAQQRIGENGRPFNMFKFRTMYADAPAYEYSPRESNDPRITPIGRFLRRTSLDEIPQLLNVLLGNMSLVGPRPEMPFIVTQYSEHHRQRLQVKPGITGLWQISADRNLLIHENIEYDLYYIRNRGFFMDLAILFHTVLFAMRGV